MNTPRHVINRQVIELTVQGTDQVKALQDEVSRVYRQRIIPLLDRRFSEMGEPDRIYRVDSVVLDIGQVNLARLEDDFVEKVDKALQRELARQISIREMEGHIPEQTLHTSSQLELFEVFARTGTIPWWADTSRPQLLAENLEELLGRSPVAFRPVLQRLLQDAPVRRRIVAQYQAGQLFKLAVLLVDGNQDSISQYFSALIGILEKTRSAASRRAEQLQKGLWNDLLYVASLGGAEYSTLQDLYRAVLFRLAADLGIPGKTLMAQMQHILVEDKHIMENFPQAIILGVSQLLQADSGEMARDTNEPSGPDQPSLEDEAERVDQQTSRIQERSVSGDEPPPLQIKKIEEGDLFDDVEKIPVGNAGLVILWPFLENFFDHLNLLDEKQFKEPAAQQRAIGLLQTLATLEPNSPEYLLPLNKILCGLEVTEVFEFGPPLLETEAEECERLLEAAIAQVPILGEMSTAGFRGTFLLRSGMLSMRDGFWLLQAEKETYDIVLERFPWSWEWVKLPWMEAPLRVEW